MTKAVYLVDGVRTPQAKATTELKDIPVPHLGTGLIRAMLDRVSMEDAAVGEVVVGNTGAPPKFPNIGRVIALESGLPECTSGVTVHRNCASGLEAIAYAVNKLESGRQEVMMAGGVESMSQMPLIFSREMTDLFLNIMKAKTLGQKIQQLKSFRFPYLSPVIAIEQGLTDPFCGLNMGETAEVLARDQGITRTQQDEFANRSHHKATEAHEGGRFLDEMVPLLVGPDLNRLLSKDIGPRANSTVEGLGKMRPYFDRKSGTVTIGNSCPITDGGAMTFMASEAAVEKYNLEPMARMIDYHFVGLDPKRMGMGPMVAITELLNKHKLKSTDIDLFEINEAFSAQVLAVQGAFREEKFAARYGISKDQMVGEVPLEKLNVNGGAVALGHPVGCSGARITVTLLHELKRRKAKYGVASLCIGGGQGGALLVENLRK